MDENKLNEYFSAIIVEKLKHVQDDYKNPWIHVKNEPKNVDGRRYQGFWNIFFLLVYSEIKKFKFPFFLTPNQAKNLELEFKGAKCVPVLFFRHFVKSISPNFPKINYETYLSLSPKDQENYDCIPVMGYNMVMNIDQTNFATKYPEELEKLSYKPIEHLSGTNNSLDKLLKEQAWFCPIKEKIGNRAFYRPDNTEKKRDYIQLPARNQFPHLENFYSTLLHEMSHSTGDKSRLNREAVTCNSPNLQQYANEELIAELGAVFSGIHFGISRTIDESNLAYIKSWLQELQNDPSYISNAVKEALRATNMIVEKVQSLSLNIREETLLSTNELIYQNLSQELSTNPIPHQHKAITPKIH